MGFYSPFSFTFLPYPEKKKWTVLKYRTLFLFSMIGTTNNIYKKGKVEKLNITLQTNQSSHSDLIGAVISVIYADQTITHTWNGTVAVIEVPAYVDYTVIVSFIEGYSTPEAYNSTAIPDNSLPLTFTYLCNGLRVNILSNQDNDTDIIEIIKATVYASDIAYEEFDESLFQVIGELGNGEFLAKDESWGTLYCVIKFPEIEGYKKPDNIYFIFEGDSLIEKTGIYQTEILTVNVSADSGSVSGFEVTISKQETVGVATKYTRLEYIESNGSQYIDTGFKPNNNTRVIVDVQMTSSSSSQFVFGTRTASYNNNFNFLIDSLSFRSDYGESKANLPRPDSLDSLTDRYLVDKNKNHLYLDETRKASNMTSSFTCPWNLYLFASNEGGNAGYYGSLKLYSCKIYNNEILIRDYIPALRSDGIAGLYDSVNDKFYTSSGSGNFVVGSTLIDVIASQTTVSGTYKIPFNLSYTIQASKVSGYNTPKAVTRVANEKTYTVSQQYTIITEIDLSLFDIYGNPINRSTANCYVVREAGTYKFPIVYGNGIKNGKVNTAAFTNNGGANSHDFLSAYGDTISSPYIENDRGITFEHVRIITSDVENLVSNVSLIGGEECRFIQFKVKSIPSTGGNAIIGIITDAYIWSWHIWVWPHDLSPVEITNSTGVKYNIMPVNLASKYDDDMVHIKNWFYQWGRKDPMLLPSAWNSTTDHTPGSITKASKGSYLMLGINYPTTFYYNSSPSNPYNWFGDKSYYNLWDAACTETGASDNDTVKTVYDPCPVGWKVPNGNVFSGLSSVISNANGIVKMSRYSGDTVGVDVPLSGCRDGLNGELGSVGSDGFMWLSSAAYDQQYANNWRFNSGYITPKGYHYRANGFSVRPVEDDNIQLDVIMINFTVNDGIKTIQCQAESGMTWFEWVHSSYNNTSISTNEYGHVFYDDGDPVTTNDNGDVYAYDNIIGGHSYLD